MKEKNISEFLSISIKSMDKDCLLVGSCSQLKKKWGGGAVSNSAVVIVWGNYLTDATDIKTETISTIVTWLVILSCFALTSNFAIDRFLHQYGRFQNV